MRESMAKLAKLTDLNTLKARATAGGFRFIDDPDWPLERIVAAIQSDVEAAGFDPEDPAMLHELRRAAERGRLAAVHMKRHRGEVYG